MNFMAGTCFIGIYLFIFASCELLRRKPIGYEVIHTLLLVVSLLTPPFLSEEYEYHQSKITYGILLLLCFFFVCFLFSFCFCFCFLLFVCFLVFDLFVLIIQKHKGIYLPFPHNDLKLHLADLIDHWICQLDMNLTFQCLYYCRCYLSCCFFLL